MHTDYTTGLATQLVSGVDEGSQEDGEQGGDLLGEITGLVAELAAGGDQRVRASVLGESQGDEQGHAKNGDENLHDAN